MEIGSVKEKLSQALEAPDNNAKYQAFINEYASLLDEVKITGDTADIAIEAVTLDQGANFLDTFDALDKKQVQESWGILRDCKNFKKNANYGTFKLMCPFAASALCGEVNTASVLGNILTAFVNSAKMPKQDEFDSSVFEMARELFLEMIRKDFKYTEWKTVKITPENILKFCEIMEKTLDLKTVKNESTGITATLAIKKWVEDGRKYAEETKIRRDKEKNKPPKKSTELASLAEHFKNLETELDKSVEETVKLTLRVNELQDDLCKSEAEGREKDRRIKELRKEIMELESKVSKANREVDERKKLNDAQVQYREDSQASLLQDIGRALKPQYGDYAETRDAQMDVMLGEIYRDKLKQIFKILEQKGIKVGD